MPSLTLIERLHALPPELYNEIYELTFTPTSTDIYVDEGYKPPATLQVDRATRDKFAKAYYGANTRFYLETPLVRRWLKSLIEAKVDFHCEVRIDKKPIITEEKCMWDMITDIIGEFRHRTSPMILHRGVDTLGRCMKFEVDYGEPEKTVWMSVDDLHAYVCDPHYTPWGDATTWCQRRFRSGSRNSFEV